MLCFPLLALRAKDGLCIARSSSCPAFDLARLTVLTLSSTSLDAILMTPFSESPSNATVKIFSLFSLKTFNLVFPSSHLYPSRPCQPSLVQRICDVITISPMALTVFPSVHTMGTLRPCFVAWVLR